MKKNKKIRRTLGYQKKRKPTQSPAVSFSRQSILQQAMTLHRAGRLPEAETLYRQVLQEDPNQPEALQNLGLLAHQVGKNGIAAELISRSIACKPDNPEAHYNLGIILLVQGKPEEAVASFHRTLTLKPDYVEAHYNLGNILHDLGKPDEAIVNYRQALTLKPDYVEAHYNLGIVLLEQGKPDEAAASYLRALDLRPDYVEAHNNLGNAYLSQGKLDKAVASYRQALSLQPDYLTAHSNLLFCMNYLPNHSPGQYLEEARSYGRQAAAKVRVRFSDWNCSSSPEMLRVGLVSGDFRNHPGGYFLENLLNHIDTGQMALFAYPINLMEDELTARIRPRFAAWKLLAGLNDETAARLIHNEGVHVLLDLSGHTRSNRLPIFAWKPAPVQASWLGYFASTGMAEMDYLVADPVSVPESNQVHFTEEIWNLPETRFCFTPPAVDMELGVSQLPALRNGCITFGCFQNLAKLNDDMLTLWGRIFQQLPKARLRLQNAHFNSPGMQEDLRCRLTAKGITPERITLEKGAPRAEYLAAHADIDIILDTFPFGGGTTTCEALWMGVPTVTLAGNTMVGRQGASMLSCAGLADWIADDAEDYVAKTVDHASDFEKLARLRAGLRKQVLASPLFDGPRFARNFETALWGMWQRYQGKG